MFNYNVPMNSTRQLNPQLKVTLGIVLFATILFLPNELRAASSLSVNPSDGGTSLRFGRVDSPSIDQKEVRIRISSTDGKQYQVFQRLIEPLINERGTKLANDAFLTYTLSGSNSSGTLYNQDQISLGYGEQLLYTSSPDGNGDAFSVVFRIDPSTARASGNFLGKILFTLRPIGGSSHQETFLDIYLEIPDQKEMDVRASSGKDLIRLSTRSPATQEGYVQISLNGSRSGIKVWQEVQDFPSSELNEEINADSLTFRVAPQNGGSSSFESPSRLESKRQLIYTSQDNADTLLIYFQIDPDQVLHQKAGHFYGKLQYRFEGENFNESFVLNLDIDVTPIFKLDVIFPPEGVRFSNLLAGAPAQQKEVEVSVKTNLGKPFVITQDVSSYLTNEKGERISGEFFSMKVNPADENSGKSEFVNFGSVPQGRVPIFFSNAKGSSTKFKIIYQLEPYPNMRPGDFSSVMSFSLEEL